MSYRNIYFLCLHVSKHEFIINWRHPKIYRWAKYIHSTMYDFHNFGLIFAGQMHCLPQRLKSNVVWNIFKRRVPEGKGTLSVEKISNNVDFSLWGNRATTWKYFLTFSSETKIMKIRHSAWCCQRKRARWFHYFLNYLHNH